MITGNGYIKIDEGRVEHALIHETAKSGFEYAITDSGLYVFGTAFEYENVYEVADGDIDGMDEVAYDRLLADVLNS